MIFIALALVTSFSAIGVFNAVLVTAFNGPRSATPIGFVNGTGVLGGFVGPYLFGWLKDATGASAASLYVYAAVFGIAVVAIILGRRHFARLPREDQDSLAPEAVEEGAPI